MDVNKGDHAGRRPLHFAVLLGSEEGAALQTGSELVTLLLSHGADADMPDADVSPQRRKRESKKGCAVFLTWFVALFASFSSLSHTLAFSLSRSLALSLSLSPPLFLSLFLSLMLLPAVFLSGALFNEDRFLTLPFHIA